MENKIQQRLEEITKKVVEKLENGVIPWRNFYSQKNRREGVSDLVNCNPANVETCKVYTGNNFYNTLISIGLNGFKSGWFGSYLQWKRNNCLVKSGEKSTLILRWDVKEVVDAAGNKEEEPFFRWFHVFNIDQVEAIDDKGRSFLNVNRTIVTNKVEIVKVDQNNLDDHGNPYYKCPLIDNIASQMGVALEVNAMVKSSSYDRKTNKCVLPTMRKFVSSNAYYNNLLRMLAFATGNACGRLKDKTWSNKLYARECLVVDLASIYLAEIFGLEPFSEVYEPEVIQDWIAAIKHDSKYMTKAISDANKAVQFILDKAGLKPKKNDETTEDE